MSDSVRVMRGRLRASAVVVVGLATIVCLAWGIDSAMNANVVGRNVQAQGLALGGMTTDDVRDLSSTLTGRLRDDPVTLEDLSKVYEVSRERIRQIEVRAFEKLQEKMRELASDEGMIELEPA